MFVHQGIVLPNQFRLLILEPKGQTLNDTIAISLSAYPLDQAPCFEALSYEWGAQDNLVQILVNGNNMAVGRSLHNALVQLRDDTNPRTLWVDAICINQGDDLEKSQQIPLMRDIYRQACSTIMWILPEDDHGAKILGSRLDVLNDLVNRAHWQQKEEHHYMMWGSSIRDAMNWLMSRTYFSRAWITQEIVVSKNPTLMLGSAQIPFDKILETFKSMIALQSGGLGYAKRLLTIGHWRSLHQDGQSAGEEKRSDEEDRGNNEEICDEKHSSDQDGKEHRRHAAEQDPKECEDDGRNRDRATHSCRDDGGYCESYQSKCVSHCMRQIEWNMSDLMHYIRVQQARIKHKYRIVCRREVQYCKVAEFSLLNLLVKERDQRASDARDKVYALLGLQICPMDIRVAPDYSKTVESLYLTIAQQIVQHPHGVNILSLSQPWRSKYDMPSWVPNWNEPWQGRIDPDERFHAGGSLTSFVSFGPDPTSIILKGLRMGVVQKIGGTSMSKWARESWAPLNIEKEIEAQLTRLQLSGNYPFTGESYIYAFLEVITAGRGREVLEKFISEFSDYSRAGDCAVNPFNPDSMRWKEMFDNLTWRDGEWDVFQSDNGYLGLGPVAGMGPGDIVCVFGHGQVPFILREWEGHGYKLIGECYVHGLMHGEAVEGLKRHSLEKIVVW